MANAVIETKIIASGDSASIVLPKEVLTELNLKHDDKVLLVKNGKGYSITPYEEVFQEQMERSQRRNGKLPQRPS
jgi:antitoxin component of MazEF toxin-antitoxin module